MDLIRQPGRPEKETRKVWVMSNDEMLALKNIFQRSWRKRIWVVQELVNGGEGENMKIGLVMWEWTALPWDYFSCAVSRLNHNEIPHNTSGIWNHFWTLKSPARLILLQAC